jgi:hypothetical protein
MTFVKNSSRLWATLFVQKSNVKREEEENLIMSFFQERERREISFSSDLFSKSVIIPEKKTSTK